MRDKVFTSDFILEGAYKLATKSGLSAITARGLSKSIGISTQPLYVGFQSISELRAATSKLMFTRIEEKYFLKNRTIDDFVDNFYCYVKEQKIQYLSLTTDRYSLEETQSFFFKKFCESIADNKTKSKCSAELLLTYAQIVGPIVALVTTADQFDDPEIIQELCEPIVWEYLEKVKV
ncbi:hypothetical protein IGI37_001099 [Enterococcus sp. AZ194]|uniref:hypothetical protein n=1 Tax=Enterococcus sp. AZ194 TaxID=2774629 RepID=UPI003F1FE832